MSITPVTLTQLNKTVQLGEVLSLYADAARPLAMVKFIGMVSHTLPKKVGATSTMYFIQDALSSACSPVLIYDPVREGDEKEQQVGDEALLSGAPLPGVVREELREGVYYAFYGIPRYLPKARGAPRTHIHIDIERARLITDFNELTFHGLEVIHSDLTSKIK